MSGTDLAVIEASAGEGLEFVMELVTGPGEYPGYKLTLTGVDAEGVTHTVSGFADVVTLAGMAVDARDGVYAGVRRYAGAASTSALLAELYAPTGI